MSIPTTHELARPATAGPLPSTSTISPSITGITSSPTFGITTSLLLDPSLPLSSHPIPLTHHQRRLLSSAQSLNLTHLTTLLSGPSGLHLLTTYITPLHAPLTTPHKLTLTLSPTSTLTHTLTPAHPPLHPFILPPGPPPPPSTLSATVCLAPHPTTASPFTRHKTTHRPHYTLARASVGLTPQSPPTTSEVLLFNEHDEITEASLSSVYLWRDNKWVTPDGRCGGNEGVSRRLAIEEGWCVEGVVGRGDVRVGREREEGEVVGLSNGVRGFWFAVVRERPQLVED